MLAWLLIPCGVLVIVFADRIFNLFGEIDFAEKYMPSGGTIGFIKVLGLFLSVGAFLWILGGKDAFESAIKPFTF